MTLAHTAPPLAVESVEDAAAALRERGRRVSAARRLVLEALFAAEGPATAEEIAGGLGGRLPPLDLTSVYRNLETFEEVGLVRHVHLGHGPGLYALAGGAERAYLACEGCGRVDAVATSELSGVREAIWERFGYEARFGHFPIVGLCAGCARTAAGRAANKG